MKPEDQINKILSYVTRKKKYDTQLVNMLLDLKQEIEK